VCWRRIEQALEFVGGQRHREPVTLPVGAAQFEQQRALLLGLDALGGGFDAEARAERRDRLDDHGRVAVTVDVLDEGTVDLDLVERERAQVAERRIAGAEVVHRDAHAERAQLVQHGDDHLVVLQQHRLGDLELEAVRRHPRGGERLSHHGDQPAVAELDRRKVDRDPDRRRPGRRVLAGLAQHPLAERDDQPGFFGDRDEF